MMRKCRSAADVRRVDDTQGCLTPPAPVRQAGSIDDFEVSCGVRPGGHPFRSAESWRTALPGQKAGALHPLLEFRAVAREFQHAIASGGGLGDCRAVQHIQTSLEWLAPQGLTCRADEPVLSMGQVMTSADFQALTEALRCPVTLRFFFDPVVRSCGHAVERSSVFRSLRLGAERCPVDRRVITGFLQAPPLLACAGNWLRHFLGKDPEEDKLSHLMAHSATRQVLLSRDPAASALWRAQWQEKAAEVQALQTFGVTAAADKAVDAFLTAAENGSMAALQALLSSGVNPRARDSDGWTALSCAAMRNHVAIVRLLLENGADVNAVDVMGLTPLILAAKRGHTQVVKMLLDHGASVNAVQKYGYTSLMAAVWDNHVAVAALLLRSGADVNMSTERGESALKTALKNGYREMEALLKLYGADVEADNDASFASWMMATMR